jgi:hypothetical protein
MKPKSIVFILAAAVTALSVLLLAGCRQSCSKTDNKPPIKQKEVIIDTNEEDTMKAFYERMRRWEVLHIGAAHRESDK